MEGIPRPTSIIKNEVLFFSLEILLMDLLKYILGCHTLFDT